MRWYIDPIGTSRFAEIRPDIAIPIVAGPVHHLKIITPRLCRPGVKFPVRSHAEDVWGNATCNVQGIQAVVQITPEGNSEDIVLSERVSVPELGWTFANFESLLVSRQGDFVVKIRFVQESTSQEWTATEYLTISSSSPVPRILFADLHVHSDDTVGTNSSTYNFSYAQSIAGLDIVGYTANDFNITASRWQSTVALITELNKANSRRLVIFPGTEWCGNSAVGGDHNVVFLDDPTASPPQFPLDKNGNVARSFEWNADMSATSQLVPGAWPLDEVYATYAPDAETHLMIPHVGGRRCNLAWHHPKLDRLVEIGSGWGQFEWLIKDAVKRGWKVGVCANSDEHRGRCGGGVPGTAVFGTKGGVTGVLSERLERVQVGRALRARRTFATSGERLVGLLQMKTGAGMQGDEVEAPSGLAVPLSYEVLGSSGFSCVEAFDGSGCIYRRDLWSEADAKAKTVLRITWGGARLYDRYRELIWEGEVSLQGEVCKIQHVQPFGGLTYVPEDQVAQIDDTTVDFKTRTSGDFDGMNLHFSDTNNLPSLVHITSKLDGYVKIGNVLAGNPHKQQPEADLEATLEELAAPGGKIVWIRGGAELFIRAELVPDAQLPRRAKGTFEVAASQAGTELAVFVVGREWDGGKVVTSPIFLKYV